LRLRDHITIKIESIAFGGHGVGRIDNFVVFVPFAAPDDELEVEIVETKKKFARGRIVKILKPSPLRDVPSCVHYENCGGCCYQHLKYEQQLKIKKKQVQDAFLKIGKIASPPVLEPVASPQVYHYRGKAQLHAANEDSGCVLGFLDVSGGKIVDIERCEIMEETINNQIRDMRQNTKSLSTESNLTIWSELQNDASANNNQIKRTVKGKEFFVPSGGFFQANLYLTDRLVDEVCRLVMPEKIDTLIDAYCGSGLFSISLSPYAQKVVGIETGQQAVNYAKRNAEENGAYNAKFICGDVESVLLQEFALGAAHIDLLLIDPPRSGCDGGALKAIATLRPQKVIYISCNPATQARDIKYLQECGYDLLSLLPLDMFPQTEHIEVIGHLLLR